MTWAILFAILFVPLFSIWTEWRLFKKRLAAERRIEAMNQAFLEALQLWNYGAQDEAIQVLREAGIKIKIRMEA